LSGVFLGRNNGEFEKVREFKICQNPFLGKRIGGITDRRKGMKPILNPRTKKQLFLMFYYVHTVKRGRHSWVASRATYLIGVMAKRGVMVSMSNALRVAWMQLKRLEEAYDMAMGAAK